MYCKVLRGRCFLCEVPLQDDVQDPMVVPKGGVLLMSEVAPCMEQRRNHREGGFVWLIGQLRDRGWVFFVQSRHALKLIGVLSFIRSTLNLPQNPALLFTPMPSHLFTTAPLLQRELARFRKAGNCCHDAGFGHVNVLDRGVEDE